MADKKSDDVFWLFILGLILGGALGVMLAPKPKERKETAPCPKCGKPVPINAPMCPWCQVKLVWR